MPTTPAVAVGRKTAAAWGNAVKADLDALGDQQVGSVTVTISAGASSGSATVTFSPMFASAPFVQATLVTSAIGVGFGADVIITALSATSMTVRVRLSGTVGSTINPVVHWLAIG